MATTRVATLGTHWVRTHSNTTRRYCAVVISHTHLAPSHARGHGTGDEVMQQREVGALEEGTAHPVRRVSEPVVVGADEHLCARRPRQTWVAGSGGGRTEAGPQLVAEAGRSSVPPRPSHGAWRGCSAPLWPNLGGPLLSPISPRVPPLLAGAAPRPLRQGVLRSRLHGPRHPAALPP